MIGMERGLQVLGVVVERGSMTVEAIADAVGLPLSTVYRYVGTLRSLGYLSSAGGRYDVGARTLGLVRRGNVEAVMGRLAASILVDLAVRTGETVLLTVPNGWTATCVESVEPHSPMRLSYRRGLALPLHVGASGKPLLAHLPARTVADYLRFVARNQPAPGAGGRQALDRQLAEIRRTGVCVTVGELEPDSIGLGVPVFTDRRIAGCLSLAGHRSRFPSDRIRAVSKQLQRAGDAVERAWAVEPWDPEATETAGFRLPDTGRPVDEMRDGRPKSSPGKGDDLDAPAR